ncbi:sensor histidine kinase [Neobacillus rhizophilus]|uniref:histidine kinase n=1 Tax=Neobacillus rhizophilus TaxID=2833579 RepID=A0A942U803_9BACI|nr:HAMP domain-containing sensor histidine kinase [Neobacillus rhizophilus]MBS4214313.1 HAMP domain-containing histidine kinase [Neobacillus rhizophilus]MBU8915894.1 HAMP domain-containing histidine kinase [Bacillus sp. FJAT-29953]
MLRNREVQILLGILLLISVIGFSLTAIFVSMPAAFLVLAVSVLLISCTLIFTKWRYKEIDKLSGYLQQISNGHFQLDVRDNYEGELSILKSQIYKVTTKLSEQGAVLQEDKAKLTNAISDISHQLKTPLTSMMVMGDLLCDKRLDDTKRAEFTRNFQVQLERMEWLVSSLLKLSKIDAGTISFKKEKVLVAPLIQKAVEPLLIPMDIKMQTLSVTSDEQASFIGDFNWTAEALINIIKNCVEHTSEGGEINISFSENALFTEITISDNGKGIAKEDLPYIFKRFYKGKNASDDSVGIGLAMAHSIVTSQQGDIVVKSNKGVGTTFQMKFYKQVI